MMCANGKLGHFSYLSSYLPFDRIRFIVPSGLSIKRACLACGIHIPYLCDHPNLTAVGKCRVCIVEIVGYVAH